MKVNFCKIFNKYILFLAKKNCYENVFFPSIIEGKPFLRDDYIYVPSGIPWGSITMTAAKPPCHSEFCGNSWFDASDPTSEQFCQEGTNVIKDLCNGTETYDAEHFCYNGSEIGEFCGDNPQEYNPNLYECKQNSNGIYLKGGITDDRDVGKTYEAVLIGEQVWMAENLNYKTTDATSRCYPISGPTNTNDDDNANCDKYGRLYNWETANDVCPDGWHLPSDTEWGALMQSVNNAGTKLKSATGWGNSNTDDYGFSALLGGYGSSGSSFTGVNSYGRWWSATEISNYAYYRSMDYSSNSVNRSNGSKSDYYSVRCVRN